MACTRGLLHFMDAFDNLEEGLFADCNGQSRDGGILFLDIMPAVPPSFDKAIALLVGSSECSLARYCAGAWNNLEDSY